MYSKIKEGLLLVLPPQRFHAHIGCVMKAAMSALVLLLCVLSATWSTVYCDSFWDDDWWGGGRRDVCYRRPSTGPCRASLERWFYLPADGRCYPFLYGGCGNNGNNFPTYETCMRRCRYGSGWSWGNGGGWGNSWGNSWGSSWDE